MEEGESDAFDDLTDATGESTGRTFMGDLTARDSTSDGSWIGHDTTPDGARRLGVADTAR